LENVPVIAETLLHTRTLHRFIQSIVTDDEDYDPDTGTVFSRPSFSTFAP
jgi:hypothetical protein